MIIKEAVEELDIKIWGNTIQRCSNLIFNFAHKSLLQVLPTAANLKRWNISIDPNCPLCGKNMPQTNKHVLANCSAPAALNRFTARHNEIVQMIYLWLKTVISTNQQVLVDLPNERGESTSSLFTNQRPDIAILGEDSVQILEITVCHDTNLINSKNYKTNKYRTLSRNALPRISNKVIQCFTFEISVTGLMAPTRDFTQACKLPPLPKNLKENLIRSNHIFIEQFLQNIL